MSAVPAIAAVHFLIQATERGHNHPGWIGSMGDLIMALICFAVAFVLFVAMVGASVLAGSRRSPRK